MFPSLCLGFLSMPSWPLGTCYQSLSFMPLPSHFIGSFHSAFSHFGEKKSKIKIPFLTSHIPTWSVFKNSTSLHSQISLKRNSHPISTSSPQFTPQSPGMLLLLNLPMLGTTQVNGYVFVFLPDFSLPLTGLWILTLETLLHWPT